METKNIKAKILKTLGKVSWNGTAVNGTPYTQWIATEDFFNLWKVKKEEIKGAKFSLYKHDKLGWVVTLFESHEGKYSSRKEIDNMNLEYNKSIVINQIRSDSNLSERDQEKMESEASAIKTMGQLLRFIEVECGESLCEEIHNELKR